MKHKKVIVEVYKPGKELPKYALFSKEDLASLIQDLKKFKKEGRRILPGEKVNLFDIKEGDLLFIFRDSVDSKILANLVVEKH